MGLLDRISSYLRPDTAAEQDELPAQSTPGPCRISRVIVYPIKSCRGTSVESAEYDTRGLRWDRRWMVVEAGGEHRMVTARTHHKLFLIEPRIDEDAGLLHINIPAHGSYSIPLQAPKDWETLDGLQVWGSYDMSGILVSPVGSELQKALSKFLEADVLLLQFDEGNPRVLGGQTYLGDVLDSFQQEAKREAPAAGAIPSSSSGEDLLDYPLEEATTMFADGYPFLIATEATFTNVGKWLEQETADTRMGNDELCERYRPNIVIDDGHPTGFQEDGWNEIKCGDETLYPVSRCGRCPMPDVSPQTGSMSVRRLPGRVVEKHRTGVDRLVKGPCLGMNAIPKARSGTLRVRDEVVVVRRAQVNSEGSNGRVRGEFVRVEDTWS